MNHRRLKRRDPLWITGAAVVLTILLIALVITRIEHVPMRTLSADPNYLAHQSAYTGLVSFAGLACWMIAATSAGLLALTLPLGAAHARQRRMFGFASLLSIYLGIDDALMIHDWILLDWEKKLLVSYGLAAATWLFVFRKELWSLRERPLLLVGAICMAASIVIDLVVPESNLEYAIEDGFKFIGLGFWALFFVATAVRQLGGHRHRAESPSNPMRDTDALTPRGAARHLRD